AHHFAHQPVYLMFFLPVQGRALVWISFGIAGLYAILGGIGPVFPALVTMLLALGYARGILEPRKAWLRFRAKRIERQLKKRAGRFAVIDGERKDDEPRRGPWIHGPHRPRGLRERTSAAILAADVDPTGHRVAPRPSAPAGRPRRPPSRRPSLSPIRFRAVRGGMASRGGAERLGEVQFRPEPDGRAAFGRRCAGGGHARPALRLRPPAPVPRSDLAAFHAGRGADGRRAVAPPLPARRIAHPPL